jgi:hypothetical protein
MRPRFLPSNAPPRRPGLPATWLAILFEIALIVTSAQLLGLGHAVAETLAESGMRLWELACCGR